MKQCCKTFLIYPLLIFILTAHIYAQSASDTAAALNDSLTLNASKYPPNSIKIIPAVNFKNTDIRDALRSIALEYQTNILVDNRADMKITISLFNLSLFDVIKIIASDNGLKFNYDTNRFVIEIYEAPPVVQAPEPLPYVDFSNGLLSVDLKNTALEKFVDELRRKTGKNFLVVQGASGPVSGALSNVELETGLRNLFLNNGFYLNQKDSIYFISRSNYFSGTDKNQMPPHNPYWVSAKNNKVTIDVDKANLNSVIDDIANQAGLSIVKLSDLNANVTIRCNNIDMNKAFEYLFIGTNFTYKIDGEAYIIGDKSSKNLDNSKFIQLYFLRADKVGEKIPALFQNQVTTNISADHNGIVVTGSSENITKFESFIKEIDKPVPQVMIEALVVEYNLDKMLQYGISMGRGDSLMLNQKDKYLPGINVTASGKRINKLLNDIGQINLFGKDIDIAKLGKLPDDFYVNLQALEGYDVVNVKSRPILSTLNGYKATMEIGTTQNYVFKDVMPFNSVSNTTFIEQERIQKIEAKISFEITPWINPNNELTLEIKPEFQEPVGEFSPDKNKIPSINSRSFSSTVRLKNGETIILGGLVKESEANYEEKTPILSDIPLIGSLFTSVNKVRHKGELMIYITPRIYYGSDLGYMYYEYAK